MLRRDNLTVELKNISAVQLKVRIQRHNRPSIFDPSKGGLSSHKAHITYKTLRWLAEYVAIANVL